MNFACEFIRGRVETVKRHIHNLIVERSVCVYDVYPEVIVSKSGHVVARSGMLHEHRTDCIQEAQGEIPEFVVAEGNHGLVAFMLVFIAYHVVDFQGASAGTLAVGKNM